MAYRKLGRDNKHRRSMLANLTREVLKKGKEYYTQKCILKSKQYDMNDCFNQYLDLYEEIIK